MTDKGHLAQHEATRLGVDPPNTPLRLGRGRSPGREGEGRREGGEERKET